MLAYKNVYKREGNTLIKNKENKIIYTDENGKIRVKTNPTYNDFAKLGMLPKKEEATPEYDPEKEYLERVIEEKEGCFVISYVVKEVEL